MDDYTSLSTLNSAYNSDMTTTHDGLVTIKHEPQEIEEDIFPIQITQQLPSFVNQELLMSNQPPVNNCTKIFHLKDCYIRLERCDKIWETLKVIKNLQIPGPKNSNKTLKAAFKTAVQHKPTLVSPMKYQPVLNNGNSSLPNFQFAIKSWKRLYSCTYCGKQYVDNRSLKAHLSKLHNINPEPDLPRHREIPLPGEIPRPVEIPRPKEFPRPVEIPQFNEFSRPTANSSRKDDNLKPCLCITCGMRYSDPRTLAGHSLRIHGILTEFHEKWLAQQENPNDYTVEDLLKRYACDSCGKRYSCMKSLRLHYLRDHNYVLPLMRGGRRAKVKPAFTPMTTVKHTGDLQKHMNVCTICGKKYTKNWYLRVHCLEVHGVPMICNRGKKNFKPLRVIKKEVLDEPECDTNLPTNTEFPSPQTKKEVLQVGPIPVRNVFKMVQCTACRKEFLSISKLRAHCLARHGIVIPRIRKSYKKTNDTANTNPSTVEAKIQNDVRTQVPAPKQVSLDRYFKSPTKREIGIHKVANTTPSFIKRPMREVTSSPPIEKAPKTLTQRKESPPPKAPVTLIKCNLCSSNCKDIRKHYIAYHKIRYPETNVMKDLAPPSDTSTTSLEPESSDPVIKKPPRKRRRKFITMGKKKKRKINPINPLTEDSEPSSSVPSTPPPFENQSPPVLTKFDESPKKESLQPINPHNYQYKCGVCGGYYCTPRTLKVHRQRHRIKGETKFNFHLFTHKYRNIPKNPNPSPSDEPLNEDSDAKMGMDSRASSMENITQSSSTSDSGNSNSNRRSVNAPQKIFTAAETTCECGRGFRDPHTMYLHKDKCPTMIKMENEKVTLARSSSDRDSGIGISITIKKKNDSYEIVSRDSGDDDKSKDSSISKDSDQMSHSSDSNFSNSVFNDRKFLELIPGQCSKDHSVLKIEDADDDVDVDIEDDSQTNISEGESMQSNGKKKDAKSGSAIVDKSDENDDRAIDPLDMDLYRCAICLDLFKDMDSLTKHMTLHESTRVLRQECPCGKTFRGAQSFLTHVEKYHPLWLQCGYCDSTFLSSKEYYSHSCDVKEKGKKFDDFQEIVCHHCLSKVRMCNFESHVSAHHFIPEKPFLCFFCKMRFSTKRQRTIHLNADHAKPNCRICGQTLRFDFVAKHEAYHQGLGFPCHTCKKAFASFKLMRHHRIDVHTKDNVKCTVCLKLTSRKNLRHHMRTHRTEEKCKVCNKSFLGIMSLENHVKQEHQISYPFFKCEKCDKAFVTETHLKIHFDHGVCKKIKVMREVSVKSETNQEPKKNPLRTEKIVTPDDGNHSEMGESVDMDEPLALEASSDTEAFLEAAASILNDITDQNDCSELEAIPPVDDQVQGEDTVEKAEKETVKEKEIAKEEETAKQEEIADETKIVNKIESVKATETLNTSETLETKEISSATENLPEKGTPNATTETLEPKETTEIAESKESTEISESKETATGILESKESTKISESKEAATKSLESKESSEISESKETATEILESKESSEISESNKTETEILESKETETKILESKKSSEISESKETTEISESKETETEVLESKETTEIVESKEIAIAFTESKETTEILESKETTKTMEDGEASTKMETSQEEQMPGTSRVSETEVQESSDSINLTDTLGSDDTDASLIDVTGMSGNSTAKSEEISSFLESSETRDTSESMEGSSDVQIET